MIWLAFVLLPFMVVLPLPAQPADPAASSDVSASARHFVDLLSSTNFTAAYREFDDTMKAAIPPAKLAEIWQTIQTQAGEFQKQLRASVSKVQVYDVVLVTCQFAQTPLDVKVVLDSRRRVSGLFFVPSRPPADDAPPPYADTNAFREADFTVGHGEWQLPGTLTLPVGGSGPWPAVILVHGSGPGDRDETVGAEKPFRDLAWGLASQGVAVLRYEKRTKEYGGKFKSGGLGRFTVKEETIDDALAGLAQLRATPGINSTRVFLLGHSLGAMLAPRIGQADAQVAGIIMLAGAFSVPLEDLTVRQIRYLTSLHGEPTAADKAELSKFESSAAKIKQLTAADIGSSSILMGAPPAYWLDLRGYDSLAVAKKLKQPLLVLQGGRDYQVLPEYFYEWQTALGGQPNVTFKLYPKLNHLFIPGEGQSTPEEYNNPGHVAEPVIADIAAWIKSH